MSRAVVASGTVVVRSLATGKEWEEMVEVFEGDMEDTDGSELAPGDSAPSDGEGAVNDSSRSASREVARRVARNQAPVPVETLEVDIE